MIFPPSLSPLSVSVPFLVEFSGRGKQFVFMPRVCALEDVFATDGLWNSSQESSWTAPGPQGFLEAIQQWPFINNNDNNEL